MSIIQKHIGLVNEHIAVQDKLAAKFAPGTRFNNEFRHKLHVSNAERFRALLNDMEQADGLLDIAPETQAARPVAKLTSQLRPQDIEGLPPELVEELSVNSVDKLEFALLGIFDDAAGVSSLDHLLIGLFKKTGEIHKRAAITAKLYRMAQKGQVYSVPGKKGWYSTEELPESRVEELFAN
jgi:hypothetical protein